MSYAWHRHVPYLSYKAPFRHCLLHKIRIQSHHIHHHPRHLHASYDSLGRHIPLHQDYYYQIPSVESALFHPSQKLLRLSSYNIHGTLPHLDEFHPDMPHKLRNGHSGLHNYLPNPEYCHEQAHNQ